MVLKLFCVDIDENKSVFITDAIKAEILPDIEGVKFLNSQGEIVSFYKLDSIKGFHKNDNQNEKGKISFDGKAIGELVEPYVTRQQNKKLLRNRLFIRSEG